MDAAARAPLDARQCGAEFLGRFAGIGTQSRLAIGSMRVSQSAAPALLRYIAKGMFNPAIETATFAWRDTTRSIARLQRHSFYISKQEHMVPHPALTSVAAAKASAAPLAAARRATR